MLGWVPLELFGTLPTKRKTFVESGFEINESELNPLLKDFQKFGIKTALFKGKFAFFFDFNKTVAQYFANKRQYITLPSVFLDFLMSLFYNQQFLFLAKHSWLQKS